MKGVVEEFGGEASPCPPPCLSYLQAAISTPRFCGLWHCHAYNSSFLVNVSVLVCVPILKVSVIFVSFLQAK